MAAYRTHLLTANLTGLLYVAFWGWAYHFGNAYEQFEPLRLVLMALLAYALCVLFGIWPDVDTDSRAQTAFYAVFAVSDLALIAAGEYETAAYLGLVAMLPVLSKHRGWIHSRIAMLLIPLPILIWPWIAWPSRPLIGLPFYGAAVVGYFSHLLLDGLIVPLPGRKRRRGR